MQNQAKDSFPSGIKKNPKDYMAITLRSDKELKGNKDAKKKQTEVETKEVDHNSTGNKNKKRRNGLSNENEKMKEQGEVAKEETVQNEEVRYYQPSIPFPQIYNKKRKLDEGAMVSLSANCRSII